MRRDLSFLLYFLLQNLTHLRAFLEVETVSEGAYLQCLSFVFIFCAVSLQAVLISRDNVLFIHGSVWVSILTPNTDGFELLCTTDRIKSCSIFVQISCR